MHIELQHDIVPHSCALIGYPRWKIHMPDYTNKTHWVFVPSWIPWSSPDHGYRLPWIGNPYVGHRDSKFVHVHSEIITRKYASGQCESTVENRVCNCKLSYTIIYHAAVSYIAFAYGVMHRHGCFIMSRSQFDSNPVCRLVLNLRCKLSQLAQMPATQLAMHAHDVTYSDPEYNPSVFPSHLWGTIHRYYKSDGSIHCFHGASLFPWGMPRPIP